MNEAACSFLIESCLVDRVDESRRNNAQDLIEQPGALLAFVLLENEASCHYRNQGKAEK